MRCLFLRIFAVAILAIPAAAQDSNYGNVTENPPPEQPVVHEISGSGSTTSGYFKVNDHWEVRWNARQVVSIAVMSQDGAIVAGAAGVLRGSLFVPLGGRYYLKITDGTVPVASPHAPTSSINAPPLTATNVAASTPPPTDQSASWHVQVIQVGTSVSANQTLTVYTPYFVPPDSAVTPAPPPPPPPVLTSEQGQAVVKVKGANATGYGFLLRTPDGTFVVTQLNLLAANPNVTISTMADVEIPTQKLMGATDRDLAMFAIKDNNYTYLPLPSDSGNKADSGNPLIIPDLGGQANPLLGAPGRIIGISSDQIDFDNRLRPGCSGAPVILAKDGSALGIVTVTKPVDVSQGLARAWPANPAPNMAGIVPYYAVRVTGVPGWETYDSQRFLSETLFLQQFHRTTRSLDSFLNGRRHRRPGESEETGVPDTKYFLSNPKMKSAFDGYKQLATGADLNQRLEAARELLSDLNSIADTDVTTLQTMSPNLYAYNRNQAGEDLAYRAALKSELDGLGNNLNHLDETARERY